MPDLEAAGSCDRAETSPGITPADSLDVAGRKVLRFHLERLVSSCARLRAGDPLAIGDAWQATLHLRSAWRIFGVESPGDGERRILVQPRRVRRELRRIRRRAGAVRELDLRLANVAAYVAGSGERLGWELDAMLGTWRDERETARRGLVHELSSRRGRRFVAELREWLRDEPEPGSLPAPGAGSCLNVRLRVASRTWDAYERLSACGDLTLAAGCAAPRRTRRAAERLAHTLEAFRDLLPDAEALLAAVEALQEHLETLRAGETAAARARAFAHANRAELGAAERAAIFGFVAARQDTLASRDESAAGAWESVFEPVFRVALGVALDAVAEDAVRQ
jgi:CHAD domain-containing protein